MITVAFCIIGSSIAIVVPALRLRHCRRSSKAMRELEVVSQQIHGLIEYIAHPLDAPSPAGRKPGRHALPDTVK